MSGAVESDATFVLEIEWDWDSTERAVSLPALVGPFQSRDEAGRWAALNIPNGSWVCRPVAYPYARVIPPTAEATR